MQFQITSKIGYCDLEKTCRILTRCYILASALDILGSEFTERIPTTAEYKLNVKCPFDF